MQQPIYVIGHKNPDTDSICGAIALAALKKAQGINAVPARIGHLNPETEYILNKVGVTPPIHISTAKSTLSEIEIDEAYTVGESDTLRAGWDKLMEHNVETLYVTDKEDNYKGLVTIGDISKIQMQDLNITTQLLKKTPVENFRAVLKGKILLEGNIPLSGEVRIADKKLMDRDLNGAIMVLNDHEDSMIKSMAKGCAMILIAENFVPNEYIIAMAKQMGVTLINTSYNVMKIIQMVYRAIPVSLIMTPANKMIQFNKNEYLEDVEREMLKTRHSSYPVVQQGRLIGSVARYHLLKSSRKQFILVDHNEKKQTINDIEQGEIIEIVDHHRIGDIETDRPIVFRNMIVGSSNTIIAMMYDEYRIKMSEKVAKLVAYAMISDTMNFNSPTCTQIDRMIAKRIAEEYDLDLEEMAKDLFENTATIKGKEFDSILNNDSKEYILNGYHVCVSQVFIFDFDVVDEIRDDFIRYMDKQNKTKHMDLYLMVFTNVEGKGSRFLYTGRLSGQLGPTISEFEKAGFVSRKKQIVPGLSKELI